MPSFIFGECDVLMVILLRWIRFCRKERRLRLSGVLVNIAYIRRSSLPTVGMGVESCELWILAEELRWIVKERIETRIEHTPGPIYNVLFLVTVG